MAVDAPAGKLSVLGCASLCCELAGVHTVVSNASRRGCWKPATISEAAFVHAVMLGCMQGPGAAKKLTPNIGGRKKRAAKKAKKEAR